MSPRWWLRAITNRAQGYAFSPVKRCRLCAHTTPTHYPGCDPWRGENLQELFR